MRPELGPLACDAHGPVREGIRLRSTGAGGPSTVTASCAYSVRAVISFLKRRWVVPSSLTADPSAT
ncbi:MAG TPA: hypothetical protein VGZ03_05330 [Acidimicrobiales bacterium]|nr:hypothetical protein [Acidimicrobiales bacterium]